jgi:glycosyltransferase involved in cell wall biosynthesis
MENEEMQNPVMNTGVRGASSKSAFTFSIITATFNRAHLLERVFRSLEAQTFHDFEWIVVDDESTDDTGEVVKKLAERAAFPVHYVRKANGGKIAAVNLAMKLATGFFIGVQDDDDWYTPHALQQCWARWQEIPEERRHEYVGLAALAAYPDGNIVGTRFSENVIDSDSVEIRCIHRARGDHKSFLRADVFREYPFPENIGGIPESLIWNRIALRYKTRFINDVWSYIEYQPDGMSARFHLRKKSDAHGMWICAQELLTSGRSLPLLFRIRAQANFVRYRAHNGVYDLRSMCTVLHPAFPIGAAVGLALFMTDNVSLAINRMRLPLRKEDSAGQPYRHA